MKQLKALIHRNVKLFFKDKGLFFTSLITPVILLVLYVTFLGNVYRDAFLSTFAAGVVLPERLVDGYVGAQLVSSLLAVSAVTVAFCSNMLMVQDKVNGTIADFTVSPVSPRRMALGYYISTLLVTLIVCYAAAGVCFAYMAIVGWYLSPADVLLILLDVLLLVMFGTALSSLINFFLSSQGQISAVGSIVSSGYGFISGAYMPISQFSPWLQNAIAFFPGTYGTSLLRRHAMRGVFEALGEEGVPDAVVDIVRDAVDCNVYFFEKQVPAYAGYLILVGTVLLLIGACVLLHVKRGKRARK